MMMPLYWDDLDGTEQVLAVAGIGTILAVGLLLHPERIQWSHFIAELLWPAAAFYSMPSVSTLSETVCLDKSMS
jgi:hypothetical protein